jgi:hypothetical protein
MRKSDSANLLFGIPISGLIKSSFEKWKKVEISSVSDLILFAQSVSSEFSHVVWYRGHSVGSSDWKIVPSAFRHFPAIENERAATMNFCRHAPGRHSTTPQQNNYAAWLCLMQHYGLPTRLLDWTESVLVAAYFAVSDLSIKSDAAIHALSPIELNRSASMNYIPMLTNHELSVRLAPPFGGKEVNDDIVATIMSNIDHRMFLQQGVFTLHTSRKPLEEFNHSNVFLRKGVIPASAKERIEWELRICGVCRSKLFPDLGNLARDIVDQQLRTKDRNSEQ